MGILTNGAPIGETITDGECETLQGLLKLLRSKKHPAWLERFLEKLTVYGDEKANRRAIDTKEVLCSLLDAVNETPEKTAYVDAMMYLREGDTFTSIEPGEHTMLLRYLEVQRSRSWLADVFDVEYRLFAEGYRRKPQQVIRGLVGNELVEFDCDVETARTMLEDHPELFQAEVAKLQAEASASEGTPAKPVEDYTDDTRRQVLTIIEDGTHKDEAELSRREFQALKKHLATLRTRKPRRGRAA